MSSLIKAGVALLTVAVLASCNSSSSGSAGSSEPPASTDSAATSPITPSASAASGTPADAATRTAVGRIYARFFDYRTSLAQDLALLQHGPALRTLAASNVKTADQQKVTAQVASVSLVSPNVAKVTWTLLGSGSPLLPNTSGYAVREGGTWKVAAQTLCALVALGGSMPALCTPTIMALPS